MTYKTTRICAALLTGAFLAASTALAQQDMNKALIDLLVKKGILTTEDVANLQKEVAAQKAPAAAAPAPAPAAAPAQSPAPAMQPAVTQGAGPAYGGAAAAGVPVAGGSGKSSPLSFRIGIADFTPFGFMDFTGVYRGESTGSSIGTGFNSIPFANGSTGQLSETKFSAQNSRLGLRIDSVVNGAKVLGYIETDFLGNAPTNLGVSSNSDTLRMRTYFVDLRAGPWEFLAGQDWTMFTPNRRGISPMPSDIFYTNDMDTNYQAGLTWARQPQLRALYHATDEFTMALSIENPDQYVGSAVVLPSAFTASEVDQGTATSQPNLFPDVIGKMAYDTKAVNNLAWHFEVAGLLRSYKINTYTATTNASETAEGEGVSGAVSLELVKGLTFVGTGFYSYGGGRYINGLGPDFIVTPANSAGAYGIGLVKATSEIFGLEYAFVPEDTASVYWSEADFGQRFDKLPNGSYVGYGYTGSASSNNKKIEEFTLANTYTFWKNPSYGALQLIAQVSRVERTPWYVAAGTPGNANVNVVYLDLRYVLP
ncbi:MAG TPA: hypothetical protein VKG78_07830 [Opitutaceae bacterium]|nr:hypothetical protein [Opitutaceae bacterium]